MKVLDERTENRVKCYGCGANLLFDKLDVKTGAYGAAYVDCPVCGYEVLIDDEKFDKELNSTNIEFPKDFAHTYSKNCTVNVSKYDIESEVKKMLSILKQTPDNSDGQYLLYMYGDVLIMVFKGSDEYSVVVANDYYDTAIPIVHGG